MDTLTRSTLFTPQTNLLPLQMLVTPDPHISSWAARPSTGYEETWVGGIGGRVTQ